MADNQTYRRVCAILGAKAGIDPEAITPGQCIGEEQAPNFYDLNGFARPLALDSFDRIEIGQELEDAFSVKISDDELDADALNHVGGLVAFIQGKLDAKPKTYGDLWPALERYWGSRQHESDAASYQLANGGGVPGFPLGTSDAGRAAAHENGHKPDPVFQPGRHYLAGQQPDEAIIVNLAAERMKRDTNPQFVTQDDKGRDWFVFSASYVDDEGREFSFRFWAQDMDDGYARLAAIKKTARMNGRLMDEIADEA